MLEHRQHRLRQQIRQQVEDAGLLLTGGHFDYGNGYHGSRCLDVIRLLEQPALMWRLAADLIDLIPDDLKAQADIVAGRGRAGAILAHVMAGLLDGHRSLADAPRRFAMFDEDAQGGLDLDPLFAAGMRGHSVLLVDECCESRDAWQGRFDLVRQAGARVAGCAVIWTLPGARPELRDADLADRLPAAMHEPPLEADQAWPAVIPLCDWLRMDGVAASHCPSCRTAHLARRVPFRPSATASDHSRPYQAVPGRRTTVVT